MESLVLFILLMILGVPTLFFLLNRTLFQNRTDRILKELQRTRERIGDLEKKLERTKGDEGASEESTTPSSQGSKKGNAEATPPPPATEYASKAPEIRKEPGSGDNVSQEPAEGTENNGSKEVAPENEEGSRVEDPELEEEEKPEGSREEIAHDQQEEERRAAMESEGDEEVEGSEEALSEERTSERASEEQAHRPPPPPPDPTGKEAPRNEPSSSGGGGWERFIGENLINKIGIGILVLGIAFFVKYAIDQGWLGEVGRVAIGIMAGAGLIGLAHRLRKGYRAFSSVLAGGGLAVLYFTITIAFQEYQLFSQTAAFAIMVVVTAFAVLLSLLYNRRELAIIALLGGFSTPFMVSTGEGNYVVLFVYLIVLNLGMLSLAYQRHWTEVNIISYVATIGIYTIWFIARVALPEEELPYPGSLIFATVFFLIFYLMSLAYKVRKDLPFRAEDFILFFSTHALYFAAGISILEIAGEERFQGLLTVGIGLLDLLFAIRYYRLSRVDRNLFFALVGLVLTFITLAVPIQLEGNRITLFWAAEAVLLLWLSQKSGIRLLRPGSFLVNLLMMISLFMDWNNVYASAFAGGIRPVPILMNAGFVTGVVSIVSLLATLWLLKQEREEDFYEGVPIDIYRYFLTAPLLLFAYLTPFLELYAQTGVRLDEEAMRSVVNGSYHTIAGSIVLSLAFWRGGIYVRSSAFIGGFVLLLSYLLFFQEQIDELREVFLIEGKVSAWGFSFHYLLIAGVAWALERTWCLLKSIELRKGDFTPIFRWFSTLVIVFVASAELDHAVLWIGSNTEIPFEVLRDRNLRIGYPILWGAISFGMMWYGLNRRSRNIRIIALTLFGVTLLKLFLYDIMEAPPFGRIIAFISLGILLLVISFMYQKLKGIVLEDERDE